MSMIRLDQLAAHPDNANRMSAALSKKLTDHIRTSGSYPRLIVRPHPQHADQYQILDGHHRAEILRTLGHEQAQCDVWDVNDEQAALLLLTLNRLHGEDDPQLRGALLERLAQSMSMDQLAKLVPDDAARIRSLMQCVHAPPPMADPPELDQMPEAVTFFLSGVQKSRLFQHLAQICANRSEALVRLLALDEEGA